MKKLLLALLLLALAAPARAQSVGASQIKKKTNGGLAADSANALTVSIYRGTSGPASPVTGQLWLDTTTTPPVLKTWDGSAWEAAQGATAVTLQDDAETFPASPADGTLFWARSTGRAYVYDGATAGWRHLYDGRSASATYVQPTTASTIADPTAAPSVSFSGSGSSTAGTHVCAYTFANSTGGETLVSPTSSSATATLNQQWTISGVTTGPTGTTARRVYCSKAGQTSPLYWVATIADNSTTSVTSTLTDNSLVLRSPGVNFSGAIPTGWTAVHCGMTTGGCGSTASGGIVCKTPNAGAETASAADDLTPRIRYPLAGFGSGGLKITARVTGPCATLATQIVGSCLSRNGVLGLRAGTGADSDAFYALGQDTNDPPTAGAPLVPYFIARLTAGSSSWNQTSRFFGVPYVTAYPYHLAFARDSSGRWNMLHSPDGDLWSATFASNSAGSGNTYANSLDTPVAFVEVTTSGSNVGAQRSEGLVEGLTISSTAW